MSHERDLRGLLRAILITSYHKERSPAKRAVILTELEALRQADLKEEEKGTSNPGSETDRAGLAAGEPNNPPRSPSSG